MKIDPYKHKERWENWKEKTNKGIPEISKENSQIIRNYLFDMEKGLNINIMSPKGPRQPNRLISLKDRMVFLAKKFEELYNIKDISKITEDQLFSFFSDMRRGKITTERGLIYKSIADYVKTFKAFWSWHIKVMKRQSVEVSNISEGLDTQRDKPKWVYLNEEQMKRLINTAKFDYKVLISFLLDTGIRSPTELVNVKVSDLWNECKEVHIRQEIVKKGSHGRRIKLMLCSELLKTYVQNKELKPEDYLFKFLPKNANKYIKRLVVRLFGDKVSEAGQKYSEISLYDFRHISCCYWLPRYKSESALKYRFGWKKSDKIHYYSELLGMRDTISEEDLLIDTTKTELQKQMAELEKDNYSLREEVSLMKEQMEKILEVTNKLNIKLAK